MNKTVLWVLGIIIIVGVWFLFSSKASAPTVSENAETSAQEAVDTDTGPAGSPEPGTAQAVNAGATATQAAAMNATVTFDGTTFTPATVTIKKGGTVTFTSTAGDMWVASNPHPTHEGYSGTTRAQHCPDTAGVAFDECSAGTSYAFTFQKTGSWGYHNHKSASQAGIVNVVE